MAYTNLEYLKKMTDGNKEIIREMIELFLAQVPGFIHNLNACYANQQYEALGKEAHKAKSSLQIMGMGELEKEMKTFQHKTIEKIDVESYPDYIRKFEIQCEVAKAELLAALENFK